MIRWSEGQLIFFLYTCMLGLPICEVREQIEGDAVWHSDYSFTNFERLWNTLKNDADETFFLTTLKSITFVFWEVTRCPVKIGYVNMGSYSLNLDIATRRTVLLHPSKWLVSRFLVCCCFINSVFPYSAYQISQNQFLTILWHIGQF